jgi:hypothetical protein
MKYSIQIWKHLIKWNEKCLEDSAEDFWWKRSKFPCHLWIAVLLSCKNNTNNIVKIKAKIKSKQKCIHLSAYTGERQNKILKILKYKNSKNIQNGTFAI